MINALPVSLESGEGIPCRPNPAAAVVVKQQRADRPLTCCSSTIKQVVETSNHNNDITTKFRSQRTTHMEPSATSTTVTGPVGERLQAGTENAPVLNCLAPPRRFHDSGAGYKYPDLKGSEVKEVNLYSAFIVVPHTQGAQVTTYKLQRTCLYLVSVHQMAPPKKLNLNSELTYLRHVLVLSRDNEIVRYSPVVQVLESFFETRFNMTVHRDHLE